MPKPSQLPRWATGAAAVVAPEPTEGKKDAGWVESEKPPNNYLNWFMRRVYEWLSYLDSITNESLTWASPTTFQAAVTLTASLAADLKLGNHAINEVARMLFQSITTDPASPGEGSVWHRSDLHRIRALLNGVVRNLATEDYVDSFVPTPIAITPSGAWAASDGLSYWKDRGMVHLKGRATSTGSGGTAIPFTLPVGYRPVATRYIPCVTYWHNRTAPLSPLMTSFYYVGSGGAISLPEGTPVVSGEYVIFDGASFLAEQ